jgi:hypothetical protein
VVPALRRIDECGAMNRRDRADSRTGDHICKRRFLRSWGRYAITDWHFDGNHVVVVEREAAWKRQVKLLGGRPL